MYDIQKMNIWKDLPAKVSRNDYLNADITELGLGVRAYNCLKRASCNTVGDVMAVMESDKGLLAIRNLGKTSLNEILEKIEEFKAQAPESAQAAAAGKKHLIKPAKKYMDCEIDEFGLSKQAKKGLGSCGIRYVRDLYTPEADKEPGWFAVRELFEKIPI